MMMDELKHLPVFQSIVDPYKVVEIAELTVATPSERQELAYVLGLQKIRGDAVLLYSDSKTKNNEAASCRPLPLNFITNYRILEKIVESRSGNESEPRTFDTSR